MNAISTLQPWAWALAAGLKSVENRTWHAPKHAIGKPIAIHASLGKSELKDDDVREFFMERGVAYPASFEFGAVVGVAVFDRCVSSMADPWFVGPYGFVLRDVVMLATPVPVKGALGIWTLSGDPLARVQEQLGKGAG